VVVSDDARRKHVTLLVDEAHLVGLDDQVADGHEETVVADDYTRALAFLPEGRAAARVGHRADAHLKIDLKKRSASGAAGAAASAFESAAAGRGGGRGSVSGDRRYDSGNDKRYNPERGHGANIARLQRCASGSGCCV
jgi:hypothetical protein